MLWNKIAEKEAKLDERNKDLIIAEKQRGDDMKQVIKDTLASDHVVVDSINSLANILRENPRRKP